MSSTAIDFKDHSPYDTQAAHAFNSYNGTCLICGISMERASAIHREWMLQQAFDRLAAVLEKLERKL